MPLVRTLHKCCTVLSHALWRGHLLDTDPWTIIVLNYCHIQFRCGQKVREEVFVPTSKRSGRFCWFKVRMKKFSRSWQSRRQLYSLWENIDLRINGSHCPNRQHTLTMQTWFRDIDAILTWRDPVIPRRLIPWYHHHSSRSICIRGKNYRIHVTRPPEEKVGREYIIVDVA